MGGAILITWPDFERDGPDTGRRLTAAGHSLRFAPKRARRSPAEMIDLLDGVTAAIVSTDPFDADVLERARKLKVIARVGVGTDSIDVQAAARRGIAVCTTPGANASSTADHAVALMLAALRRVPEHDRAVRAGRWPRTGSDTPYELSGATVGLIGYGSIGRLVHRRLSGFSVRVLVTDPHAATGRGAERAELEPLLLQSDIVSLHLPLIPSTRHILDRSRLKLLKPSAVVVNTARGGLIDEEALADALESGALRAAALDVFALEPPGRSRLSALPNVVLTPHTGGLSERSVQEMTRRATEAVLAVLDGRTPDGMVTA